jgi:hypothetical protein
MRLPWFQLAHQVLPIPVGRNQMLGYPRKGHSHQLFRKQLT